MSIKFFSLVTWVLISIQACGQSNQTNTTNNNPTTATNMQENQPNCAEMGDEDWKSKLTPAQFKVLREQGTERAFTGKYYKHDKDGTYTCAACGHKLFDSDTKFDSGTGWPSYFAPHNQKSVKTREDNSHGMQRIEVLCANCNGHLGHLFPDGPKPTGQRYCINSIALEFEPKKENTEKKE